MHSSTSSSDLPSTPTRVAATVVERPVVAARWGLVWLVALLLSAAAVAGWEAHWRARGFGADISNSDGLWFRWRRAVEPTSTVIVGSSRVFFDIDLDTWAEVVGGPKPIMLALEGTPPWAAIDDLAADPEFRGFLVIGYTPPLFFGGFPGERAAVARTWRDESPSARFGQRVSMELEGRLAFLDDELKAGRLIAAAPWPVRAGLPPSMPRVPRLSEGRATREQLMWSRLETDEGYREHARSVWSAFMSIPFPPPTEEQIAARVAATKAAVDAIRARGGEVLFVRCPSAGPFLEHERKTRPRAEYWDRLLGQTGAVGIHFEDHPELRPEEQGFELPEWSHLRASDRIPFTRGLAAIAKPTYDEWLDQQRTRPKGAGA